jgi:hypothetical protein
VDLTNSTVTVSGIYKTGNMIQKFLFLTLKMENVFLCNKLTEFNYLGVFY